MSVTIDGEVFPNAKQAAVAGAARSDGLTFGTIESRIRRAIRAGRALSWADLLAPPRPRNESEITIDGVEYPSLIAMYKDVSARSGIAITTLKARLRVARRRGQPLTYKLLARPVGEVSKDAIKAAAMKRLRKTDCREEIAQAIANIAARKREIARAQL